MTPHVTERLSDYLDGDLDVAGREAVERHLAGCAECAEVVAELRVVVLQAQRLPERPAPAEVWSGIVPRLRPRRPTIVSLMDRIPRRVQFTLPQLAAAGFLLALLSGGSVWLALQRTTPVLPPSSGSIATRVPSERVPVSERPTPTTSPFARRPRGTPDRAPIDASVASFDEASYDAAVAELERALREHGSELDSTTVRILQQNLAIIDRAIEQARQALLADPSNPYLNGHLADQMKLKVRLLQRATDVVAAHG